MNYKLLFKRVKSYFPTSLPVGISELEAWADECLELSGLPITRETAHQALCNMIMHISPLKGSDTPRDRVPKNFFVKGLRKGAANQIAAHVFYELQKELDEKRKALKIAADPVGEELKQQVKDLGVDTASAVDDKTRFQ